MILAVKEKTVCLQIRGKCHCTNIKVLKLASGTGPNNSPPHPFDCVMLFFPVTFPQATFWGWWGNRAGGAKATVETDMQGNEFH